VVVNHNDQIYIVMDEATIKQIVEQIGNAMSQFEEMLKNIPEDQRPMVEQMMKSQGMGAAPAAPPEPELRPTADTATHSGFATRKYEVYVADRKTRELWVTDWDNIQGFQEARPAFESMASFMQDLVAAVANSAIGGSMSMNSNGYEFMETLNGFPVLTREFDQSGAVDSETLLMSATQQTIDPADLEPPPNYTRRQLPSMPGQ
jgi:hypothetical protein